MHSLFFAYALKINSKLTSNSIHSQERFAPFFNTGHVKHVSRPRLVIVGLASRPTNLVSLFIVLIGFLIEYKMKCSHSDQLADFESTCN